MVQAIELGGRFPTVTVTHSFGADFGIAVPCGPFGHVGVEAFAVLHHRGKQDEVAALAQFHLEPRGKYIVRICKGTACHVRGANRIGDTLKERLGIGHAETTADLKFTAEYVACIGACGMAPVIMVNDATYGSLTVQKMNEVIDKYVSMD